MAGEEIKKYMKQRLLNLVLKVDMNSIWYIMLVGIQDTMNGCDQKESLKLLANLN